VRRAIATVLLLQALVLASGFGFVRAGGSCCCARKRGATCPMRTRCENAHRACSLDSGASLTSEERSVPAVIEAAFRVEPRSDARGGVPSVSRAAIARAIPPELPPPRLA